MVKNKSWYKVITPAQIFAQIEDEQEIVNANTKLIEIYEQKTKDNIREVWRE